MLSFEGQLRASASRLAAALDRATALSHASADEETRTEALLFNLERAAWAMIEMAAAWAFELRLGIARKETENFDLIQRLGWLGLDEARRFKQLCEYRNLSSRDPSRVDLGYLAGGGPEGLRNELEAFGLWNSMALGWLERDREGSRA